MPSQTVHRPLWLRPLVWWSDGLTFLTVLAVALALASALAPQPASPDFLALLRLWGLVLGVGLLGLWRYLAWCWRREVAVPWRIALMLLTPLLGWFLLLAGLRHLGLILTGLATCLLALGLPGLPTLAEEELWLQWPTLGVLVLAAAGAALSGLRSWRSGKRPAGALELGLALLLVLGLGWAGLQRASLAQARSAWRREASPSLLEAALRSPHPVTKAWACWRLRETGLGSDHDLRLGLLALGDPDPVMAEAGLLALERSREPAALPAILEALIRPEACWGFDPLHRSGVRWRAAQALDAFPAHLLPPLLGHPDPRAREALLHALYRRSAWRSLVPELQRRLVADPHPGVAQALVRYLAAGREDPAAILPWLHGELASGEPERVWRALTLADLLDPPPPPLLDALVALTASEDARVNGWAPLLLAKAGLTARRPIELALPRASASGQTRLLALLKRLPTPEAQPRARPGIPLEMTEPSAERQEWPLRVRVTWDGGEPEVPRGWHLEVLARLEHEQRRAEPATATGGFLFPGLPAGSCWLEARLRGEGVEGMRIRPGESAASRHTVLGEGVRPEIELMLHRSLRLTAPWDSSLSLPLGATFAAPLRVAWEDLGPGTEYHVRTTPWCQTVPWRTERSELLLDLPAGPWTLDVTAHRAGRYLGRLEAMRTWPDAPPLRFKGEQLQQSIVLNLVRSDQSPSPLRLTPQIAGLPWSGSAPKVELRDAFDGRTIPPITCTWTGGELMAEAVPPGYWWADLAVEGPLQEGGPAFSWTGRAAIPVRGDGQPIRTNVTLEALLPLREPEDGRRPVLAQRGEPARCTSPLVFAWTPLPGGIYDWWVDGAQADGRTLRHQGSATAPRLALELPPGDYGFFLTARLTSGKVAELGVGGKRERYRFVVVE